MAAIPRLPLSNPNWRILIVRWCGMSFFGRLNNFMPPTRDTLVTLTFLPSFPQAKADSYLSLLRRSLQRRRRCRHTSFKTRSRFADTANGSRRLQYLRRPHPRNVKFCFENPKAELMCVPLQGAGGCFGAAQHCRICGRDRFTRSHQTHHPPIRSHEQHFHF